MTAFETMAGVDGGDGDDGDGDSNGNGKPQRRREMATTKAKEGR